jgi:hypothetical protein
LFQQENPELIWNEETRARVARIIGDMAGKHYQVPTSLIF